MIYYFFVFFLCVRALIALEVPLLAKSAILINADTGRVLWEKNAHEPSYPASITKVITALYALEKKGDALDALVEAESDALWTVPSQIRRMGHPHHPPYRLETGGTSMGLQVGEIIPLRVLLYGLMLESGNDAANVIARYVSGSIDTFIQEMNQFVREKGCLDTQLFTPHGLPHPDHRTTAYDMAILTRLALQHPAFCDIVRTVKYGRPETNRQPAGEMTQFNALLKPGQFYYPKAFGVKTGYTIASGYTLVAAAGDTHRRLIAVLLGCQKMADRYKDAITLFEAAFNEPVQHRVLLTAAFDRFSHTISGARGPVEAHLAEDLVLTYYPSEEPEVESIVHWYPMALPLKAGTPVGEVVLTTAWGESGIKGVLLASHDVAPTWGYRCEQVWQAGKIWSAHHVAGIMAGIGLLILGLSGYLGVCYRKK